MKLKCQRATSRSKDKRDTTVVNDDGKKQTCLFLAACRDSFSLAELCPCYPLWRGSRYFCAVTSPGDKKKQKKMSMSIGKFIKQKIQDGRWLDTQSLSSEY